MGTLETRVVPTTALMRRYALLFWDVDGVIKESVAVKSDAFGRLLERFGAEIARRVGVHQQSHSGMSRHEKLPLYLEWAGCDASLGRATARCSPSPCGCREHLSISLPIATDRLLS